MIPLDCKRSYRNGVCGRNAPVEYDPKGLGTMRSLIVSMICAAAMMLSGCALSGPGACNNGCGGGMLHSGMGDCGGSCGGSCGGGMASSFAGGSCGGNGMPCGFENLSLPGMGQQNCSTQTQGCGSCGDSSCGGGCPSAPMSGAFGTAQTSDNCNTGCAPGTVAALPPIGAGLQSLGFGKPQGARMLGLSLIHI